MKLWLRNIPEDWVNRKEPQKAENPVDQLHQDQDDFGFLEDPGDLGDLGIGYINLKHNCLEKNHEETSQVKMCNSNLEENKSYYMNFILFIYVIKAYS